MSLRKLGENKKNSHETILKQMNKKNEVFFFIINVEKKKLAGPKTEAGSSPIKVANLSLSLSPPFILPLTLITPPHLCSSLPGDSIQWMSDGGLLNHRRFITTPT